MVVQEDVTTPVPILFFYFILTLIWLVSHAELLDTYFFSQKTFEGIKTETWVRLGNYLGEYAVSGENKITEIIGFLVRVGVLSKTGLVFSKT